MQETIDTVSAESKNSSPLTIIVPIFITGGNHTNFLEWIDSPKLNFAQIILVHDLTDGQELADYCPKVFQAENITVFEGYFGSPGESRNIGLELARGKYVVFWDFDDFPLIEAFLKLFWQVHATNSRIGIGSYEIIEKGTGKVVARKILPSNVPNEIIPFTFANPGIWRWIFSKSVIKNHRFVNSSASEDQIYLGQISAHNEQMIVSQEKIYKYFVGYPHQITNQTQKYVELIKVVRILRELSEKNTKNSRIFCIVACYSHLTKLLRIYGKHKIFRNMPLFCFLFTSFIKEFLVILKIRNCIKESVNRNQSLKSSKRIELFGGLGNQLFQFSLAINLSRSYQVTLLNASAEIKNLYEIIRQNTIKESTNTEILKIEFANEESFFHKKMRNLCIRISAYPDSKLFYVKFLKMCGVFFLLRWLFTHFNFVIADGNGYDPNLVRRQANRNVKIIGYFQTYLWSENCKNLISEAMRSIAEKEVSLSSVHSYVKNLSASSVFVQYRLGDYKSNPDLGLLPPSFFYNSIKVFTSNNVAKEVLLFSNDINEAYKSLNSIFQERININTIDFAFSDISNIYLLSQAKNLVISNSSFGWWGAYLCQQPDSRIVVPNPWFVNFTSPRNLLPNSWVKLDRHFTYE